jgi:hypothetical protein
MSLPFGVSIAVLGLVQAGLVALPGPRRRPAWIERLGSPWWAVIPALSIVVVVAVIELSSGSATALAYLALVAVPPLAAFALGALLRGSRAAWAWVAFLLFGLAWISPGSLVGEAAATALTGLGCVALGWLLVCAVPAVWLRFGVYAMAAIDAVYVSADLLQGPNAVLTNAAPLAELPRLQAVHLGSAVMGFGDLFIAALVGCLLARDRPRQLACALLVAVLALIFDLLFFAVDELPATVPVAVALALVQRLSRAEVRV